MFSYTCVDIGAVSKKISAEKSIFKAKKNKSEKSWISADSLRRALISADIFHILWISAERYWKM